MYGILLMSLVVVLGWGAFPASLSAAPGVVIDQASHDFGIVNQGERVTADFAIKNPGTDILVISKVEFSMPGMNIKVKQRIEPAEDVQARITWDTSLLRRDITGLATLYFDDPSVPPVTLSLSGVVTPAIEFLPRPAYYFSQFTGERHSQTVTLINNQDSPLEITSLAATGDHFDYRVEETETGKAFALTVSTKADAPVGRFRDSLFVETSSPRYPRLHLEVNILVKPDVFLSQDKLEFGRVSMSQFAAKPGLLDFTRQSVVIGRREGEMAIEAISSDLEFLALNVEPKDAAPSFILEVGLIPGKLEPGDFSGVIKIGTSDTEFPELQIPVSATIADH